MTSQDGRLGKPQPYVREHRITTSGRHLWYQLEVLQQPERARACGSGPKSSADRRPVDPPPVVILRVFEGETFEGARDITFDYNVDFFCYASLEHARPMAHGRVQTPAATSPPVLTGFPVSGCCYLDRPDPAGYFLFPDLSVRHEGRYRLIFSLYELIKENKDLDPGAPPMERDGMPQPGDACHRMDLKSADFVVYSAKKFPGLTESTTLSRTVAEQGCRVRIRRDVRMRRRDTKASAASEYDNHAEDEFARRRRRTQTPDHFRARSASNSSLDRSAYPDQRRTSNADFGAPAPASLYQAGQPSSAMLNFGHGGAPAFVQPFAPSQTSRPQSTPVSPAQSAFPSNTHYAPPVSPRTYPTPTYSQYDHSDQDTRRRSSGHFPPITAKPLPQAMSFGNSVGASGMPPLSQIVNSPPLSAHSERLASISGSIYQHIKPHPAKRGAEDAFMSGQDQRNVLGQRPQPNYETGVQTGHGEWIKRSDGTHTYVDMSYQGEI
ncbi:velvet factor-domain-containing protein [Xylariaceae sp. FL0016]|nr:velvet factor-domain-containing protein [Xylariaceae sp. FL0016]